MITTLSLHVRCVIYVITHLTSGRQYVGQTKRTGFERWRDHRSSSLSKSPTRMMITRALRRYGADAFSFEVVEFCSLKCLNDREAFWVQKLNTLVPAGFNLVTGGGANAQVSQIIRDRLSEIHSGRKQTPQQIAKRAAARSDLWNNDLIFREQQTHRLTEVSRKRASNLESNAKISQKLSGRVLTETHKQNVSKGMLGKKRGPYRQSHREASKRNWEDPVYREKQRLTRERNRNEGELR